MSNTLISGNIALPAFPVSQISNLNKVRSRADSSMPESFEAVEIGSSPRNVDMQPDSKQMGMSLRSKRKLIIEPVSDNKKVPSVRPNAVDQCVSPGFSKKVTPNTSRTSASGKKVIHVESNASKPLSTFSKKVAQPEVSPKGQTVSHDSVRAKLRESLASALALVTQKREGSSDGKTKKEGEVEVDTHEGLNEQKPLGCSVGTSNLEISKVGLSGNVSNVNDQFIVEKKASSEIQLKETCQEDMQTWNYMGPEFQTNSILSGQDSFFGDNLFFKDELLQGNGLSWVSDSDPHMSEMKDVENTVITEMKHEEVPSDKKDEAILSPESLALEIESELYKLYGGVNKKYKEKGRSLVFNLKDRNNPELRERVMYGEIPPDRLCSMTAEELASKELSQWRIAKAEELDQMKVLPDSDANMRRLVKKTHKGEYQVDLEPDVGVLEEVSPILSVPSKKRLKTSDSDSSGPSPTVDLSKLEQYEQCEITIPSDGTDMQGLMVDDVKDLPPIVSLDEFMESLNKEPPFENLPVNSGTTTVETNKGNPDVGLKSMSPIHPLKHHVNATSAKTEELNVEVEIESVEKKSGDVLKASGTQIVHHAKQVPVWEGLLQLNISSMANFVAFYKSGEKANTKEWAGFFDIKGRVRLDAFDKFLQALPMSRSRAIMVSHFSLKEECSDSERSGLLELVDSYITDERLGFAEPAPEVELYLCPPRTKTVDMIINHLPKSYTEKLVDIDDGLIGIVVWRKVQINPVISPNSLSHQKHETTNYIVVNDAINRNNVNLAPMSAPSPTKFSKHSEPEEDDDVPPGFGPMGGRDDDDLPEFNFSGGPNQPLPHPKLNPVPGHRVGSQQHNNPHTPARQVDQMRELIQKYGQNGRNSGSGGGGIPTQSWNDDDDDIPEWQPQAAINGPPSVGPRPIHTPTVAPGMGMTHYRAFQQPPQRPPIVHPIQPLQPPMSVQQQGMYWPYGANVVGNVPSGQFNRPPNAGHLHRDWRSNKGSNNKGF